MWWPGKARAEERALLFKTLEAVMEASASQSKAAEAQARAVEAHLALFRTPTPPTAWVNRDEDELLAELERKGYPRTGTRAEQLKWVEAHADQDIDQLYELKPLE